MAGKENPTPEGDRIAKVLSRRGVASRREAERLIEAGEVKVNGKIISSPALNVTDADVITISGHPLPRLEPARLWLYYKPDGLVTSASDEKGRETVFDHLPDDMPRVMSVGRLDLNSEGLLLLTNDGELKRRLELPSTGWLRKYRVRVNGNPTDPDLEPLRQGITVEGERFQPMNVVLDRHQGANAWLTVGLREGKNREIRRAMAAIDLTVNRLIRISYGPFRLGELKPGEVEEVRTKVLREQLGEGGGQDAPDPIARKPRNAAATAAKRSRPGDGIRALARAWDEATEPRQEAAPRRSATTTSRGDDDRPARSARTVSRTSTSRDADRADSSAKPRRTTTAPRRDDAADDRNRDRAPRKTTAKSGDTRAPRSGTRRDDAGDERGPAKRPARTAATSTSPRPRAEAGTSRGPSPAKTSAGKAPSAQPAAPKIAGPKIAGPKPASPKPAGPKITGPRRDTDRSASADRKPAAPRPGKPPSRPRKG